MKTYLIAFRRRAPTYFVFLSCTKFSEDARDDIPAGAFLPISAFDVTSLRVVCLCAFVGVFVTKDVRPPEFI